MLRFGAWSYPRLVRGTARLVLRTSTVVTGRLADQTKRHCLAATWLQVSPESTFTHRDMWGPMSTNYKEYLQKRDGVRESYMNSPTRFQKVSEREDRSDMPVEAIKAQYKGKQFITHRGCQVIKTPEDMIIFDQLFWELRPATVIELGTFTGGSAIWMADMLRMMGIKSHIYSMDMDHSLIEDEVRKLQPDNVTFLKGDSHAIEKTFTEDFLSSLPNPWLVSEDSHENLEGVLKHFMHFMEPGDYVVVEDLNPEMPCDVGYGRVFPELAFKPAGTVGLEHLKKFLSDHNQEFSVDSYYTDFFGYNGTCNWHGYIRRM